MSIDSAECRVRSDELKKVSSNSSLCTLHSSLRILLCLCLLLACSCASRPVEEIVTTDASRASILPPGAQPVAREPDLPAQDPDIEVAGDRIAEAMTYLN